MIKVLVSDYECYSPVERWFESRDAAEKYIASLQYCVGVIVDSTPEAGEI